MIFLICVVLFIIFFSWEDGGFSFFTLLAGFLTGAFIAIIVLVFSSGIFPSELQLHQESSILSIKHENSIEGTFFLGSGSIDSETYYFYLQQREDGGIKYSKINTSDAILYETEDNFRIERWRKEYKNPIIRRIFIAPVLANDEVRFYIPEGSILYNFILDL